MRDEITTSTKIRIAVIRSSSIGDVVLASACLDLAKRLDIEVVWIGREPALGLLKSAWPDVKFVLTSDGLSQSSHAHFLAEVGPVSAIVDLQTNLRSRRLIRLFQQQNIPCLATRKFQRRRWFMIAKARMRSRVVPDIDRTRRHPIVQFQAMLETFAKALLNSGVKPNRLAEALPLAKPSLSLLSTLPISGIWGNDLTFGTWIALAPGASYQTKMAPISLWIESLDVFMKQVSNSQDIGLLIAGNETDRKVAVELLDQLNWSGPVLNLAGKLTLSETAQALSKMKLLLTNDSGLLHIAESVGTPVIAVFGPTTEKFGFTPWRQNSFSFSSPIGCRPCSKHGKSPCRYEDKLCFESINTQNLGTAAAQVFSSSQTTKSTRA